MLPTEPVLLRPYAVNLDWLTINMRGPEDDGRPGLYPWGVTEPASWFDEREPDTIVWVMPTTHRTAQFSRVAYINNGDGEKLATVSFSPHQNLHGPGWMQIQFANHTLYGGEWTNIFRRFRYAGCEYLSISRVDIAADGIEGEGGDWPTVLNMAARNECRYYGKCEWLTRTNRRTVIGGEFGSRSSNKFVRAYRKKREMKVKGVKPHIVNAWINALGFNPMEAPVEVNRYEIQLKGREIRRYFPDERNADWLLNLSANQTRTNVIASMAESLFDFRIAAERARDSVPVCKWDWTGIAPVEYHYREPRKYAVTDHTIKTHLRAMFMVGAIMSDPDTMYTAERVATAAGSEILEWYSRKRFEWMKEIAQVHRHGDKRTMAYWASLRGEIDPA
jgi:hypothetical protein